MIKATQFVRVLTRNPGRKNKYSCDASQLWLYFTELVLPLNAQ